MKGLGIFVVIEEIRNLSPTMKAATVIAFAVGGATGTSAFQVPVNTRQVVGTPSRSSIAMSTSPATGSGKGLDYNPDKYTDEKNKGNYRRLTDALKVGRA